MERLQKTDDERSEQIDVPQVQPLTHENLAQLQIFLRARWNVHGTIQARWESSRCASCKHRLLKGPKCVFCKQRMLEGQHDWSMRNTQWALNAQFPQDQPQCIKLQDSHKHVRSHARVVQEVELSQLGSDDRSVTHEGTQPAGQRRDEDRSSPIQREFCTQKCLLGLSRGLELDAGCPNVTAHRQGMETNSHQIHILQLAPLLTNQLGSDPFNGCTPLKLGTLPGRLHTSDKHTIFEVTLKSHGYTFLGKATQMSTVKRLKREKEAYHVLRELQGEKVPVLLGDLYFPIPWSLSPQDVGPRSGSQMVYMLLLSHAGRLLRASESATHQYQEIRNFRKIDMRGMGLKLDPIEIFPRNVLWNDELGRFMFIDFERVDFSQKWTAVIWDNESE